jgi:hypothetical protein
MPVSRLVKRDPNGSMQAAEGSFAAVMSDGRSVMLTRWQPAQIFLWFAHLPKGEKFPWRIPYTMRL